MVPAIELPTFLFWCLLLPSWLIFRTHGWTQPSVHRNPAVFRTGTPARPCISSLKAKEDTGDKEDERKSLDRMEHVRQIQSAFYNSAPTENRPRLDTSTGTLYDLPLWRVGWSEVPGRSNVLNVHEGIYTNMFERILHQPPPWYVGHLFLPEGSRNLKSHNPKHQLAPWNDTVVDFQQDDQADVVGTLLRIADYRRIHDGRILLLVQALERFVVSEVQQEIPYSVANVQIIPDTEEIDDSNWRLLRTEGDVAPARALAVQESLERWHRYEYENTVLPLPMTNDLEPTDIVGSALARVLPYSAFSPIVQVSKLRSETLPQPPQPKDLPTTEESQSTLEERLVQGHILSDPYLDPELTALSTDELERRLWLALNDFLKSTRTPVSPVLLGLLPVGQRWPRGFLLERIAKFVQNQTKLEHKYVRVSAEYPALRRQKRLSYSAAALLEEPSTVTAWRRQLLAIPSTKDRLAFVLQQFNTEYGAFQ